MVERVHDVAAIRTLVARLSPDDVAQPPAALRALFAAADEATGTADPAGSAEWTALVAGWPEPRALLAYETGALAGSTALLLAHGVRACREVLLALEPGRDVAVATPDRSHRALLAELLAGTAYEPAPGWHGVDGRKRLGPYAIAAVELAGGGRRATSRSGGDSLVSALRALATPEGRRQRCRFLLEGTDLLDRALDSGLPVEAVAHTRGRGAARELHEVLDRAAGLGLPREQVSGGVLGSITASRPVPELVASVHVALHDVSALPLTQAPSLLVAEDLQSPDNLGMLLRTADAAGVDAVVVSAGGADPYDRNCVRAARGAVGRLPVYLCADVPSWLSEPAAAGFRVAGMTARGSRALPEADLSLPRAVVVGNERRGLSREALAACTERVRIPMAPGQSSLNVAVAAGVVLFQS